MEGERKAEAWSGETLPFKHLFLTSIVLGFFLISMEMQECIGRGGMAETNVGAVIE